MSTELLAPVWTHLTNVQPVRAKGCCFFDEQGNRYLDFTSGIGVINTGHRHPCVVDAIRAQAGNMIFAQLNVVMSPAVVQLAEKLNAVAPTEIARPMKQRLLLLGIQWGQITIGCDRIHKLIMV